MKKGATTTNLFLAAIVLFEYHPRCFGSEPNGHQFSVDTITATQTSGSAGNRQSTKRLRMVDLSGAAPSKADLVAQVSGKKPDDEPSWSGPGVDGQKGSLQAKWEGSGDSAVVAKTSSSEATVDISVEPIRENSFEGSSDTIRNDTAAPLTRYLKTDSGISLDGKFSVTWKRVDYYNNGERLGKCFELTGGPTLSCNAILKVEVPLVNFPGVKVKGELGASGTVSLVGRITYDESKPDPKVRDDGALIGEISAYVKGGVAFGLPRDWLDLGAYLQGGTKLQIEVPIKYKEGVFSARPSVVTSSFTITGSLTAIFLVQKVTLFKKEPLKFGESNKYTSEVKIMEVPDAS